MGGEKEIPPAIEKRARKKTLRILERALKSAKHILASDKGGERGRVAKAGQASDGDPVAALAKGGAVAALETSSREVISPPRESPSHKATRAQKEAAKAKASLDASQQKLAQAMRALHEANEAVALR